MKIKIITVFILLLIPLYAVELIQDIPKDCPGAFNGGIRILGIPIGQTKLAEFIGKIKNLHVGTDTPDDIIGSIGKTIHVIKQGNGEEWLYQFIVPNTDNKYSYSIMDEFDTGVKCTLTLNEGMRLSGVKVEKIHDGHEETLYSKGGIIVPSSQDVGNNGMMPNLSEAPASPKSGQIYFSNTDKHV